MKATYTDMFATNSKLATTSNGDQLKYKEKDIWYKLDKKGYEGLSEIIASRLAKFTNLINYPVVDYYVYKEKNELGCYSKSFLCDNDSEQTLYRAITRYFSADLEGVYSICRRDYEFSFYEFILDFARDVIGVDISDWLALVLKFDWLILNVDRHFNNIVFVTHNDSVSMPIFDNGAAFASDLSLFPLEREINFSEFKAKPFYTSFSKQVTQAERFSGERLRFISNRVAIQFSDLREFYSTEMLNRVEYLLRHQMSLLYPNIELEIV